MQNFVLSNASLATLEPDAAPYGLIDSAALVIEGERICWRGPMAELPAKFSDWPRQDCSGKVVTPALIDCHTHLIHGGNRAREFEQRLQGASYQEIAQAGGGIVSTVAATRHASEDSLLQDALSRVDTLIAEGLSTLEIKSGYGLDQTTELKMLRVAKRIAQLRPVRIKTTFLGAHALPPEYTGRAEAYIDEVCLPTLSLAHAEHLVDAVDGFCETIGFSPWQIERVFIKACDLGLNIKLHAEQLSNQGGAALAAKYGALSVDHLEYLDEPGVEALARTGTVAVLLPGAFYTLNETKLPPVSALRNAGVGMAVATDYNPGTSPLNSLLLAMNMACTLFKLTPEEALIGATRNAAKALGLDDIGTLAPGMRADLAIWNIAHPAELAYRVGFNPLHQRIFGGQP